MIRHFAISLRTLCVFACALFAGGAAHAVDARSVSSTVPLEACGLTRLYAPQGDEGLNPAEDLGDAYVLQIFHQADGGMVGETHVIVDCAVGEAWSFAPPGAALMRPDDLAVAKSGSAYEQLVRFVHKSPRGYDDVAGWRRANDITLTELDPILGGRIVLGLRGERYDLTCGCKLFNPASIGAR